MPGARSPSGLASAPLPQPRRSRSPRALAAASPGPSARSRPGARPLFPSWDLGRSRRRHGEKKLQRGKFPAQGEVGAAAAVPSPGELRRWRGPGRTYLQLSPSSS